MLRKTRLATALMVRYKDSDGWHRAPAVYARNRRVRSGFALIEGIPAAVADFAYEIRYYKDRKPKYKAAGHNAADAEAQRKQLQDELEAKAVSESVGGRFVSAGEDAADPQRIHLRKRAKAYITRQKARGKLASLQTFENAFDEFMSSVKVEYADELIEDVVLRWHAWMREHGNEARTIHNKHGSVFSFLRWAGVDTKKILKRAPEFTEKAVESYKPSELKAFFDSLTQPYHRMVFRVLLMTGLRMQEAMYATWPQFDFERGTLTVQERDEEGFIIKDKAERTLPIPAELIEELKVWKKTHKGKLVLGTRNDTPNWKWLDLLKRLARRAGLNCGACKTCQARKECERWYLHKFRATYITNLLRSGIDPRTVMEYSGHEDLQTILRYLVPAEMEDTQGKVNAIKWVA